MKIEIMREVDRHAGRILSYLLLLFTRSRNELPKENVNTIVVSKYFGIGSITLATPLLQSLREHFPKAKIRFLTFNENAELIELYPFIDEVIIIRNNTVINFILDTLKTLLHFRYDSKIDVFIDMEFFSHYSAIMALLSGAKFRVGFHTSLLPRGKLLTHRVPFNSNRHVTEAFQALGQKIGTQYEYSLYKPSVNITYTQHVFEELNSRGLKEREYVIVNTQGSSLLGELKQWQTDKWIQLVELIVKNSKIRVIFTGVKKDHSYIEKIITSLPTHTKEFVYNTAGDFNIAEFLVLLNKSKFLITVDSGSLHLAQSLEVPCVALFGPETPTLYGPRGKYNRTVYLGLYCSPCFNVLEGKKVECTNPIYNQCMKSIEVQKVWDEVISLNRDLGGRD